MATDREDESATAEAEVKGPSKASTPSSKRQRKEARRRAARQRALRTKVLRWGLLSLVVVIPALATIDRSGPDEAVEAVVIRLVDYKHFNEKSGVHTHKRATILVDGSAEETVERADGYQRGQKIQVWVRKGRITGWPYYNDIVRPGDEVIDSAGPEATPPAAPVDDPATSPVDASGESTQVNSASNDF